MKSLKFVHLLIGAAAFSSFFWARTNRSSLDGDKKAVEEATQQFYVALNAMFDGDVEPMKAVWSHADDVSYMGPVGGIRIGWDEVLADWEAQAALKLGGQVEPLELHMTVGPQIAVVINEEKGENLDADGKPVPVSLRATHIFRKEKGQWKMIGDHADLLPFLQK
jgi:ketosteroid isomerase-like protein